MNPRLKRRLGGMARLLLRTRTPCPRHPRKVLVVAVGYYGDIVIIQPFLHALRAALPRACISLMVERRCAPLLKRNTFIDSVICYDRERSRELRYLLAFTRDIRRERYDLAIVHYGHFHLEDILFLMGITHTIVYDMDLGFDRVLTYELFSQKVAKDWSINEIDNSLKFLEIMGVHASPEREALRIPVMREALPEIARRHGLGIGASDRYAVVMHIGAGYRMKKWPPSRWANVGDALSAHLPVTLFITGSADDRTEQDEINSLMRRPAIGMCGETSIEGLIALLEKADLLLTTDSGPKHFAYALRVPTVELSGPSEWWRWGAYWDREVHIALDKKPNPRIDPLLVEDARYDLVIQQVTAEEAAGAALRLLSRARSRQQ